MSYFDPITGKPIDRPSDLLPASCAGECDHCGGPLISRCLQCGAPVCCPACCDETTREIQGAGRG